MNLFSFRYFGQRSSSIFPSPLSILVILYALCEVNNLLPFASFTIVNSFIIPGTYTRNSPSYDRKYAQQKQDSICPHLLSLKTSSLKPFNPIVRKYNNILHILHATNDKTEEDIKKKDNLSDTYHDMDFDVSIIGAGPAGTIMATLLSEQYGLKVALIDPKLYDQWPNNYGVWLEEWKNLESIIGFSLEHCLVRRWPKTSLYCGGSHGIPIDEELSVDRTYARVDRIKLKEELFTRCQKSGNVNFIQGKVDVTSVTHLKNGSKLDVTQIDSKKGKTEEKSEIYSTFILDCSGYSEPSLINYESNKPKPGFQIAYGVESICDHYPYDENAMLLMDYRTNYAKTEEEEKKFMEEPTFMYAMPMGDIERDGKIMKRVFWEETSLVARPAMSFEECKIRMQKRLKAMNVNIVEIEEDEYCYIPMGGPLPLMEPGENRILAFGGKMGLVHASTGYHICRCLAASGIAARAIAKEMHALKENHVSRNSLDQSCSNYYKSVWSPGNQMQRAFMVFGGEFLMRQGSPALRGFFNGFFNLPTPMWSGFLAGWPGLPGNDYHDNWLKRLKFGIDFFFLVPFSLKIGLAKIAVLHGGLDFLRCVTPLAKDEYKSLPAIDNLKNIPSSDNQEKSGIVTEKSDCDGTIQTSSNVNKMNERKIVDSL